MNAPYLDQAILKSLLHYDPQTGLFTWRTRSDVRLCWNVRYAGKRAGYAWKPKGANTAYWCIRIFDWPFLAHRLAHLYMVGEWPDHEIDHRDLDGLNNRWDNLRAATPKQNHHNRRSNRNNKLGIKGVSKHRGRYRAAIFVEGHQRSLGYYDTSEGAQNAYRAAVERHRPDFGRCE